jgi:hypothetical protein
LGEEPEESAWLRRWFLLGLLTIDVLGAIFEGFISSREFLPSLRESQIS